MREEDTDWSIYHIVAYEKEVTAAVIGERTGLCQEDVESSLKRLEKNCLLDFDGTTARILPLQEVLLRSRVKEAADAPDSPVIIEDGVIKVNPDYKG